MHNELTQALRPGTNFAQVAYSTKVATAAAHKHRQVQKHVVANVQLFSNIKDAQNVYAAAVKRSAAKIDGNDADAIQNFVAKDNYFRHTDDCFSIVEHKQNGRLYLFAIYNNAESVYSIDGAIASKEEVAELLTPSARKNLLEPAATVVDQSRGIEHSVRVRTIAFDNITWLKTNNTVIYN